MKNDENIDQLFRNSLQDPDIPFNEEDWLKMSEKLDRKSRKSIPLWMLWASAVAAILLVGLFLMFFPFKTPQKAAQNTQVANKKPLSINQKPAGGNKRLPGIIEKQIGAIPGGDNKDVPVQRATSISSSKQWAADQETKMNTDGAVDLPVASLGQVAMNNLLPSQKQVTRTLNATMNTRIARPRAPVLPYSSIEKSVKSKMLSGTNKTDGLVLSAMLAPDISYAKSSVASKVSTNIGLLASYGLSSKLSVTTGAIYSNKYYNSKVSGLNAYGGTGSDFQINASCNVIDIPLNVNYKLMEKKGYSITVNTGLSSYLMLKENYDYIYPEPGAAASVVSVSVRNQNQHLLGVANISFVVERKISSRVSIGVQPFMKVPLTGIGQGDANLKSSGMSFSVNMNLFHERKPGRFAGLKRFNPLGL